MTHRGHPPYARIHVLDPPYLKGESTHPPPACLYSHATIRRSLPLYWPYSFRSLRPDLTVPAKRV